MNKSLIEKMNSNQKLWIEEYEKHLSFILELSLDESFVDRVNYDSNHHIKDNFTTAGIFISNFTEKLFHGFFDDLFITYKKQRLNAVVSYITTKFMNTHIFHGDDVIHFGTSNKQALFVSLIDCVIVKKLDKC